MCGLAGSTALPEGFLARARRLLRHRGPDGEGDWRERDGSFGLAHTRLAIIDLSPAAAQPMVSDCGRYVIAFNGEIYNFRSLRAELEAAGVRFRSDSDTEVLLALLKREGAAGLARAVGMFALALWDMERRELLLARDRLGIKPLLYAPLGDGGIAFASEIRALKEHPGIDFGIDSEALSEYLACLYIPAPRTIHRGIRKLPPGHWLRWRDGKSESGAYWQPRIAGVRAPTPDEAAEEVLPLLRQAVSGCMISDVPVGCFLSGGLDSSVIAALMAEESRRLGAPPVRTFTMTFAEAAYDERAAAARVAAHIGSRHTELAVDPATAISTETLAAAFGEPFGNPTALLVSALSKAARAHVTVALVGDGGDEVFAGYPRYQGGRLARAYRRLPAWLRETVVAPLAEHIPESRRGIHGLRRAREFLTGVNRPDPEMYAGWVEYFAPGERRRLLGLAAEPARPIAELYAAAPSSDPLDAMQQTDLLSFLPGNLLAYGDAMSMAHSLELRLPMLDHRVIEMIGGLAPDARVRGGLKAVLRAVARRLLPAEIARAGKRGFNPPMGVWLHGALKNLIAERLTPGSVAAMGLAWEPVAELLALQARGRRDVALKVWALLALDGWRGTA
ncbi:MAG: asparagine synthase (glutamine-hydrolyzing) [Rhodospirillales bacterium]|nr:asparagine synthase (glutamine-hydrolyzing) [Rhodospirillales bacterium]